MSLITRFTHPITLLGTMLVTLGVMQTPAQAITVQPVTSPGGVSAWLVEDHSRKVISLFFGLRGGGSNDPEGKAGLATFTFSLLDEGAGTLDSGAFQGKLDDLSASIRFSPGSDYLGGSVQTLTQNRDAVFDLLRLALSEPRFDAEAVERVRAQLGQGIDSQLQNPDAIAGRTMAKLIYGTHPYARPNLGTRASVAALGPDDFRAFMKQRLGRDTLQVTVVGDITPDALKPLLDKTFGGLPEKVAMPHEPADVVPKTDGKLYLIKKPIPQSVIQFAQPGIALTDKDFYPALVLNHILGGGAFNSRLGHEVREKRGLAYGISTGLQHNVHVDLLAGQVGTQNAKAAETIKVVREEWAKLRDEGPSETEVNDAKTYLSGSYALGLNSTSAIAGRLIGIRQNGFGMDYIDRRPALIAAVTVDDVRRVAKRLLDPAHLTFVVVGDPEGVTPDMVLDPKE